MISKINFQTSKPVTMKSAESKNVENPIINTKTTTTLRQDDGLDALNSYGKALFNMSNKLDIKPLELIDCKNVDGINGERIYNSNNKLVLIIDESDKYVTNYHISEDDVNHINYIEKIDKQTNKPVFTQHCERDEDRNVFNTYVTKLNPNSGKEEAFTCYEDGKIAYSGKNSVNKKGEEVSISKYYDGYGYSISMQAPNSNNWKYVQISEDKKNIKYSERKETKKGTIEKNVEFYNGLPLSVEESRRNIIPNLLALEPLLDSDLKPAERFDFKAWEETVNNIDGEVTRYSNGNIESKKFETNGETIVAYYNTNNQVKKIVTPDLEIEKNGEVITIKEQLGDGVEKQTITSKNGVHIIYDDNGFKKELYYDTKTNKPISYNESKVVEGEKGHYKSYYFNKSGMVEDVYER